MQQNPPSNREAEANLLGAIMSSERALNTVMRTAEEDEFFLPEHRDIFRAIRTLHENDCAVDLVTVTTELRRMGTLERDGGTAYITQLCARVVSPSNAVEYHKIIADSALRRRIIMLNTEMADAANGSGSSAEELLASLEDAVISLARDHQGVTGDVPEPAKLAEVFTESLGKIVEPISTPFSWVNDMVGGLLPGNLFTIAGRTSAGKSAFALQLAKGVADFNKTCYISLEMPPAELLARYVASETEIPVRDLMLHRIADEDQVQLKSALAKYSESRLYFTSAGRSPQEIERIVKAHRPEILIIDTVNLIKASGESERVKILNVTRELKQLALAQEIPIIILAQLSRRTDEKLSPTLADIKESASIEEDSDVVLLLSEIDTYDKLAELAKKSKSGLPSEGAVRAIKRDGARPILALIQKNRNGRLGRTSFRFDGKRFRFTEIEGPEQMEMEIDGDEDCPF
ncbi:MAG: replicative DNA helicase [Clostridiales bacterium]|nr:replicative DNA helicase [Clostridiales bacterium]